MASRIPYTLNIPKHKELWGVGGNRKLKRFIGREDFRVFEFRALVG